MSFQKPTTDNNLAERSLYMNSPRERRMNVVSEYVTIYGEAPSGAHEAEPKWTIWRETKDESGRITVDYAQDGSNNLYWIYNSVAFNPVPDNSGKPYYIELDNNIVYDGMVAGLPVANISVYDVDDLTHTLSIVFDPFSKFTISGNTLFLQDSVQLIDIAYPLKIRATDPDGNQYEQVFAIYVQDPLAPPPAPPQPKPPTPVTFDFTLELAFKMLSNNTGVDLTQLNSVVYNKDSDPQTVVFLDASNNLLATLYYTASTASWSPIDTSAFLLEDGSSLVYEDGGNIIL